MFEKGINCKIIRVIKAYYESSQMKVQKGNEHSNIFKTSVGVIQGGALSPELYSCYAEGFFKDIEKTNTGIQFGSKKVDCFMYADDMILIGKSKKEIQIGKVLFFIYLSIYQF